MKPPAPPTRAHPPAHLAACSHAAHEHFTVIYVDWFTHIGGGGYEKTNTVETKTRR